MRKTSVLLCVLLAGACASTPGPASLVVPVSTLLTYKAERVWGAAKDGSVLDVDAPGSWKSEAVALPSVIRRNGQLHMYFAGAQQTDNAYVSRVRIGLAVSTNGREFTVANGGRPVLAEGPAGAFDSHSVSHPMVLPVSGPGGREPQELWMYYVGADGTQGANGVRVERLGLARSRDGVTWQREPRPVIDLGASGEIDSSQVASPFVLQRDGAFHMWYGAYDGAHRIAYATSADGVKWVKHGAVQGLRGADAGELGPSVYFDGREYLMFYNSVEPESHEWKLYAALSTDGKQWSPAFDGKPVVPDAPEGTFAVAGRGRNSAVHLSELVQEGSEFVAFYAGEDKNSLIRIGLLRFSPAAAK